MDSHSSCEHPRPFWMPFGDLHLHRLLACRRPPFDFHWTTLISNITLCLFPVCVCVFSAVSVTHRNRSVPHFCARFLPRWLFTSGRHLFRCRVCHPCLKHAWKKHQYAYASLTNIFLQPSLTKKSSSCSTGATWRYIHVEHLAPLPS